MFSFAASEEYWDWLRAQPILNVGFARLNYMDLARTMPCYVYILVRNPKGKIETILTNIRLCDFAKNEVPNIKPYKQFKNKTVKEMEEWIHMKKQPCPHKKTRFLDCEEHGRDCKEIVCCECGESVSELRGENHV